jgi:hypothetical protein
MWRFPIFELAAAAGWATAHGGDHLRTTGIEEAAVHLDVAKTLTVETLGQPILGFTGLDLYNYTAK